MSEKIHRIGVLRGEGVGPALVNGALSLLAPLRSRFNLQCDVQYGGSIGRDSAAEGRGDLPQEVIAFCGNIFANGGSVLAGAGGGRFVYELRRHFALHYKLNPIHSYPELEGACRLKPPLEPTDILVVRENMDGLYQGVTEELRRETDREIRHTFSLGENQVRSVLRVAANASLQRKGKLSVVCKDSGLPKLHALWRECTEEILQGTGVNAEFLDIDYAAYRFVQEPWTFDVVVAPNCFGDILADLGGVIAGSRGLTYGGSFSGTGAAVYQTNHGAAYELAGRNVANPVAQILSLAMLLRNSFLCEEEAVAIENAVRAVWKEGWRTADLVEPATRIVGTKEFTARVAGRIA